MLAKVVEFEFFCNLAFFVDKRSAFKDDKILLYQGYHSLQGLLLKLFGSVLFYGNLVGVFFLAPSSLYLCFNTQ